MDLKWVAQFYSHDNDDGERPLIKVGIKPNRHLIGIYFDHDLESMTMCRSTEDEAIELIKKTWGDMETFKLIIE